MEEGKKKEEKEWKYRYNVNNKGIKEGNEKR